MIDDKWKNDETMEDEKEETQPAIATVARENWNSKDVHLFNFVSTKVGRKENLKDEIFSFSSFLI